VLVAHACNPSYSGGRDQEDPGSKPAWAIVGKTLSRKIPSQKMAGGVAQGVGPEFKPQNHKKGKKEMEPELRFHFWKVLWYSFGLFIILYNTALFYSYIVISTILLSL
jgi:hypothetical protein